MSATWYCCRQRAGPLVKECRALRPRFAPEDTDEDHKRKALLKKYQRCAVNRRQVDRLELRLALIGELGMMYTLTFDSAHLPQNFKGVRQALRAFQARVARWRERCGKSGAMDYIYCIEGLHRRYHVHYICSVDDLSPAELLPSESGEWPGLWRNGTIDMEWVLYPNRRADKPPDGNEPIDKGGFRRLAEYLNKEATDGFVIPIGRHPWSCSRTLTDRLEPPERWTDASGVIDVPEDAVWVRNNSYSNDFGSFYYSSWIEPLARDRLEPRACAHANYLEI